VIIEINMDKANNATKDFENIKKKINIANLLTLQNISTSFLSKWSTIPPAKKPNITAGILKDKSIKETAEFD